MSKTIVTAALVWAATAGVMSATVRGGEPEKGVSGQAPLVLPPVKMRTVLPPPAYPKSTPVAIDTALRAQARDIIEALSKDASSVNRANAIEAAQHDMGDTARPIALRGLSDDSAVVRFAACIAVGDLKYVETRANLLQLAYDKDPSVRLTARYGLHKLGDTRLSEELLLGLRDDRPAVRRNTVMLLGMLGEKSAVVPLHRIERDPNDGVRLLLAEALWKLGDESALEPLVARTVSIFSDDVVLALLALAAPRNPNVLEHLRGFLSEAIPEVELAAARGAGMVGSDEGYGVATKYYKSPDRRQRSMAAMAFGDIGRSDSQEMLKVLIADPMPDVRLAAASAVLKLRDPQRASGQ